MLFQRLQELISDALFKVLHMTFHEVQTNKICVQNLFL